MIDRNRILLASERRDLQQRLSEVNADPILGILEKSAERRAIRARLAEIAEEIEDLDFPVVCQPWDHPRRTNR